MKYRDLTWLGKALLGFLAFIALFQVALFAWASPQAGTATLPTDRNTKVMTGNFTGICYPKHFTVTSGTPYLVPVTTSALSVIIGNESSGAALYVTSSAYGDAQGWPLQSTGPFGASLVVNATDDVKLWLTCGGGGTSCVSDAFSCR